MKHKYQPPSTTSSRNGYPKETKEMYMMKALALISSTAQLPPFAPAKPGRRPPRHLILGKLNKTSIPVNPCVWESCRVVHLLVDRLVRNLRLGVHSSHSNNALLFFLHCDLLVPTLITAESANLPRPQHGHHKAPQKSPNALPSMPCFSLCCPLVMHCKHELKPT